MNKIIKNPYYIFGVEWAFIIATYQLGWSNVYPKLRFNVLMFFLLAVLLTVLVGILYSKLDWAAKFSDTGKKEINSSLYFKSSVFFCVVFLIEALYSHGIPLFGAISYTEFGIPKIHTFIMVANTYLAIQIGNQMVKRKNVRRADLLNLILSITPFILQISRGTIAIVLMAIFVIFITQFNRERKMRGRTKMLLVLLVAIGLYLFGILGNYRLNTGMRLTEPLVKSTLIMEYTDASPKFKNAKIPKPYYWTYLYATSPLANLQNQILVLQGNQSALTDSVVVSRPVDFIFRCFIPDVFSKKLLGIRLFPVIQVSPVLTASSGFFMPYMFYGFGGMMLYLIYLLLLPLWYMVLVKRTSPARMGLANALLVVLFLLSPFDNMLAFSGVSLLLPIPILLGLVDSWRGAHHYRSYKEFS
ncbi:hypothetical protein ACFQ5J_04250 [Lacticaseibacillus baoqingensis]|uniref:Oligosaccharide repeat unit polymerase n=1 Tax=Lacticaseibacillus baoqingensis TaxID=2486013 RepID=A0ABW4E5B3_9LACO|nr:hypothetical protein [Lacticaseibacillus baoqingensis]